MFSNFFQKLCNLKPMQLKNLNRYISGSMEKDFPKLKQWIMELGLLDWLKLYMVKIFQKSCLTSITKERIIKKHSERFGGVF